MKRRLYISCPFPDNMIDDRQRAVRAGILELVAAAGYEPQEFGVSGIPFEQAMNWTVKDAQDVMRRCRGAIVLAFPRWRFHDGQGREIFATNYYVHIEGTLALTTGIPTLIVTGEEVEGLYDVGIIGQGTGKLMAVMPQAADATWVRSTGFRNLFEAWKRQMEERRDVFFGYCSEARSTALGILRFLNSLNISVLDWEIDFTGGVSILQQIEHAAQCPVGVFLFTKDDQLAGSTDMVAAPRDNVVFETGYFTSARGKDRVLIIREAGAKLPADLGGDVYLHLQNRNETATIETRLRKFIEDRL